MISFVSSFEIINVVTPDLKIFLYSLTSSADFDVFNPNVIKTLLANGLSTFSIKEKALVSNDPRGLSRNFLKCTILDRWVLDNFIMVYKSLAKVLQGFETCVSINNKFYEDWSYY